MESLPRPCECFPFVIGGGRGLFVLMRPETNQQAPSISARPKTPKTPPSILAALLPLLSALAGEEMTVVGCEAEDTTSETVVVLPGG